MKRKKGYTLIELLMVIGIIIILAAVSAPALMPLMKNRGLRSAGNQVRAAVLAARTIAVSNSVYSAPLVPLWAMRNGYAQYFFPGKEFEVWVNDSTGSGTWVYGGMVGQCLQTNGLTTINPTATDVTPEDALVAWVYLDGSTDGISVNVGAGVTAAWGTSTGTKMSASAPARGQWVQIAVGMEQLGVTEPDTINSIALSSSNGKAWWDLIRIYRSPYWLPQDFMPDPTLVEYPIEFEKDGRLKPTAGGHWSDRMIIVRDLTNGDPDAYDSKDNGGNGNGVWECEPWTDSNGNGWCDSGEFESGKQNWGLDRVAGTGDSGESISTWDYEGKGATSDPADLEPPSPPEGQIYIKIDKITGSARVCGHPGD